MTVVLNIGGEGEEPDAINVNTLAATIRPLDKIRQRGLLIQGDFLSLPIRSASVDMVVGNRLPTIGDEVPARLLREAHRVLRVGGELRVYSSSGAHVLLPHLAPAGFSSVTLHRGYATGMKL